MVGVPFNGSQDPPEVIWGGLGWFGAVWGGLGWFGVVWGFKNNRKIRTFVTYTTKAEKTEHG